MNGAIKRMGVAYGKLGLATNQELIGRRTEGVKTAASKLALAGIAPLVQAAFDIGTGDARFAFLSDFQADLTFDVQPSDREAVLLAGAVAECEIESRTGISAELALAVVTCACGGLRKPPLNDQLVSVARHYLTDFQGEGGLKPKERPLVGQPQSVIGAIRAIPNHPQFNQVAQQVTDAFQAVSNYAEAVATSATESDNEMLEYIQKLEQEMRVYWWVTGGWSDTTDKPFRQLPIALAAICAGSELAAKHSSSVGLFAAPALIDLVLERGRPVPAGGVAVQDAAVAPDRNWRNQQFDETASGPLASLLPITAALGLSAASEDAEDWKPRFKRLTGLEPDVVLSAVELGAQLYRERLVVRALG